MDIFRKHKRKAPWIGVLLLAMLVTGCAGIEPYEPRDHREEGPEKGLFTGAEGEWVIFRKADEPDPADETNKNNDETPNSEEKKKTNSDEGQQ